MCVHSPRTPPHATARRTPHRNVFSSPLGENVIILVQNMLLVVLLWKYSTPPVAMSESIGMTFLGAALFAGMFYIPADLLKYLPIVSSAGGIVGRVPQVLANFKQGHTGQLSLATNFLQFVGILARVFTTMQVKR